MATNRAQLTHIAVWLVKGIVVCVSEMCAFYCDPLNVKKTKMNQQYKGSTSV